MRVVWCTFLKQRKKNETKKSTTDVVQFSAIKPSKADESLMGKLVKESTKDEWNLTSIYKDQWNDVIGTGKLIVFYWIIHFIKFILIFLAINSPEEYIWDNVPH